MCYCQQVKQELKNLVTEDTIRAKTISANDQILLVNAMYFKVSTRPA